MTISAPVQACGCVPTSSTTAPRKEKHVPYSLCIDSIHRPLGLIPPILYGSIRNSRQRYDYSGTASQSRRSHSGQRQPGERDAGEQLDAGANVRRQILDWRSLKGSRYTQWAPVSGQSGDAYAGQSPHGATLKMYLNRAAAGRPVELPDSSILVKENYGPDGKTLMAITVMYRTKNYNPEAGDWYWIKYLPDGRVDQKQTPTGPVMLAGKPKGCIECHVAAEGGDYAFFNDGP